MTTLRQAAQAVLARWDSPSWQWSVKNSTADLMAALRTALEQQAEPVVDCPRCGHVCSQRPWVGLTDNDWGWVADRKGTSLDTFDQGAAWAQQRLKELNT